MYIAYIISSLLYDNMGQASIAPISPVTQELQQRFGISKTVLGTLYKKYVSKEQRDWRYALARLANDGEELFTAFLFDRIGSQDILTFDTWLTAVCTFCMLDEEDLLQFGYDAFDLNRDGVVTGDEVRNMMRVISKIAPESKSLDKGLRVLSHMEVVNLNDIVALNTQHPHLFWALFRLQQRWQDETLGAAQWAQLQAVSKRGLEARGCGARLRCWPCGAAVPDREVAELAKLNKNGKLRVSLRQKKRGKHRKQRPELFNPSDDPSEHAQPGARDSQRSSRVPVSGKGSGRSREHQSNAKHSEGA